MFIEFLGAVWRRLPGFVRRRLVRMGQRRFTVTAGALIIEEAGGRCADRLGAPWQLGSGNIMAANSHIFEQFIKAARWK